MFDAFRTVVQASELHRRTREDSRNWPKNPFFKFLVARDPEITLGAMAAALNQCLNSVIQTDLDFRQHVEHIAISVFKHLNELQEIKEFRDPAVHPDKIFRKAEALRVARTCQRFLDSLILGGAP